MKLLCLLSLFSSLALEAAPGLPPALVPTRPVDEQPNLEQPNLKQPNLEQPNLKQPNLKQPNLNQPNLKQPNLEQPNLEQPNLEQPNLKQRLASALEMVVVTTADWDAVEGTLQRFERRETGSPWRRVGGPAAIVVGKKGMGWGTGFDRTGGPGMRSSQDPVKKEGDGKSPAGVFGFGTAFGDPVQAPSGWKLPYIPLTPTVECVDDIGSRSYNQIVDRDRVTPDWNSSEHMLSVGQAYRWGVVIDNNGNPTVPSGGSCVFMHIWSGPGKGTAGCTAIAEMELESILAWLDPSRLPLLVQLPRAQYHRLRNLWHLPVLATP